jgi:hypothetical protein
MENTCTGLVGKPEGRRTLRRCRRRWEDIIKVDLKKIELKGLDWVHLPQDREKSLRLVDNIGVP